MKKIEEIICEVLMDYGFDDDYIKYSSYKFKLFSDYLLYNNDDYNFICEDTDLYFDGKEEEALFKILAIKGYKIHQFDNYYFTKTK